MKDLHQMRYSFTEPLEYLKLWEDLKEQMNMQLNSIKFSDVSELMDFQNKMKPYVGKWNGEFEKNKHV
jgi:hypothetical protein